MHTALVVRFLHCSIVGCINRTPHTRDVRLLNYPRKVNQHFLFTSIPTRTPFSLYFGPLSRRVSVRVGNIRHVDRRDTISKATIVPFLPNPPPLQVLPDEPAERDILRLAIKLSALISTQIKHTHHNTLT